jgi:hypothetical protein
VLPDYHVERPGISSVEIARGKLPEQPTIVALEYAR